MQIDKQAFSAAIDVLAGEFPPESGITIEVLRRLCTAYEAAKAKDQPTDCDCEWFAYSDGSPYQRHRCRPGTEQPVSVTRCLEAVDALGRAWDDRSAAKAVLDAAIKQGARFDYVD